MEIEISRDELEINGYTEIVDQDGRGEVTLRHEDGTLEVFSVRDSFSGWSLETVDGQPLEFCRSIP